MQLQELFQEINQKCIDQLFQQQVECEETGRKYPFVRCILPPYDSLAEIIGFSQTDRKVFNELFDYVNSKAYCDSLVEMFNWMIWNFSTQIKSNVKEQSVSFAKIVAFVISQYTHISKNLTELLFQLSTHRTFEEYSKFVFCNL